MQCKYYQILLGWTYEWSLWRGDRFIEVVFRTDSTVLLILQPTRLTSHSNTLIDNIVLNVIDLDIISGNLIATISDHLPQFAIIPNMFGNISANKSNIYERDWSKFDREILILDYFSVIWRDLLKIMN